MDVEIEKPHVHAHKTGHHWMDFVLPVAALFVSFVSILIAWHHGEVMKELVHQNEKLVEANSLPYLELVRSDIDPANARPRLQVATINQGVGPARVAEVTLSYRGKPISDLPHLLEACCAPGILKAPESATSFDGIADGDIVTSTLRDSMIPAGQTVKMIDWRDTPANHAALDRLRQALATGQISLQVCYCSVFDDCWARTLADRRPRAVAECRPAAVPYRQ